VELTSVRRGKIHKQFLRPEGKKPVGRGGVDERKTLKWVLEAKYMGMWVRPI
jgi:hypothetical protein